MEFPLYYYDEDEHECHHVSESEYISIPEICFCCKNTGIQVPLVMIQTVSEDDEYDGFAFTACHLCKGTSMHYLLDQSIGGNHFLEVSKSFPSQTFDKDFSDSIPKVSKDFIDIYNQSKEAEKMGLDKIAGMGYRKATEFLVTDYLKWLELDDVKTEWLESPKTSLSAKIAKIPDKRTRDISKAISYLGNDQTHYTPRHPEYDIQSIKSFISILAIDIDREIAYREVEKLVEKK